MANLAGRDRIFNDLFDFRRSFDQIFNHVLSGSPWEQETGSGLSTFAPTIETCVDKAGKKYLLRAALPGIDPKDVQINVQGNTLTISGERKEDRSRKEAEYMHQEISYGAFQRMVTLPEGVDTERINAEYHNGVLEITAPISASALPRRIEIKSSPSAKQMSA
jgi:HSP20 family protein